MKTITASFGNLKMKPKLITLLVLVGAIPLAVVSAISLMQASHALNSAQMAAQESMKKQVFDQLVSLREVKGNAIKRYMEQMGNLVVTFSENRMVVNAAGEFKAAFLNFRSGN